PVATAARWRVYAYKTEFLTTEPIMTLREPIGDLNANGQWDAGEPYQDWNGNGKHDGMTPILVELAGIDATAAVNAASSPSLVVKALPGGVDADGSGAIDLYQPWANAKTYP